MIDMEEMVKIQEQALFHQDAICNCVNPKCFFHPMLWQVPQSFTEDGEHNLEWGKGGQRGSLVHSYIRLHSYCGNKGFVMSTALAHARVNPS